MEEKTKLFNSFKNTTKKLAKLLDKIEDTDLSETEIKELIDQYDIMNVHATISFEKLEYQE